MASRTISREEYLQRLGQLRVGAGPQPHAPRRGESTRPGLPPRAVPEARVPANDFSCGAPSQPLSQVTSRLQNGVGTDFGVATAAASGKRRVKDNFVNTVVDRCGPAVVRVETEQKVEAPAIDNSDIFSFFFGIRPDAGRQERKIRGCGSGFCIDGRAGTILTNAHVIQDADRVTVLFGGQRSSPLECDVLESDEVIDLAVLRVKGKISSPLPSMPLGFSESTRTGDWSVVLGNPLGLQNTCTLGIVSSMDRSTGETGFDWMRHPLMQTDAAVNQGNSGGPMLNELGEVIGIISMRALCGEGIGFAIPVDSIKAALPILLQGKKVPRAYLGLKMSTGSSDTPQRGDGAEVMAVIPDSPAADAGLEVGDQLLELNGRRVRHFEEVQKAVRSAQVGARLTFKVHRADKKQLTAEVIAADVRDLKVNAERMGRRNAPKHRIVIMP